MKNKKVYAFGDSIVYGHTLPERAFMNIIAEQSGVILSKYAVNGATIVQREGTDNDILNQLDMADAQKPDIIVFDGYTNDALGEVDIEKHWGKISSKTATEFDTSTFCGAFEKIIYTMKNKWQGVPILFVTIHKSGGRPWELQSKLRDASLKICEEWGVDVVDIFKDCTLDTRDETQMKKYIIDGAGSHPNEQACREFYVPAVTAKMKELLAE